MAFRPLPKLPGSPGFIPGATPTHKSDQPYDEDFYTALDQLMAGKNTFLSNLQQSRNTTNQAYQQQAHDLATQHPYDVSTLNDNYGSAGLGFSSGYGDSLNRLQTAFGTNVSRLREAHRDALNQLRLNRENYLNEFRASKASLRQAAADRLSAKAGSLGFGKTGNAQTLANKVQGN